MNLETTETRSLETEAQDHAEETRYAVTHHGKELHPEAKARKSKSEMDDQSDEPWQID